MRFEAIGDTMEIYFKKGEECIINILIKILARDFDYILFEYRHADSRIGSGMVAFCARQYTTQKKMKEDYFLAKEKAAKQMAMIEKVKRHERAIQNVKNRNLL